tara:strand:- start:387 stop:623 length:237 start_codon:yes stop_codon:yes gene_type:complete
VYWYSVFYIGVGQLPPLLDGNGPHAGYCLPHLDIDIHPHHRDTALSLLQYGVFYRKTNSMRARDVFPGGIELIFYLAN